MQVCRTSSDWFAEGPVHTTNFTLTFICVSSWNKLGDTVTACHEVAEFNTVGRYDFENTW